MEFVRVNLRHDTNRKLSLLLVWSSAHLITCPRQRWRVLRSQQAAVEPCEIQLSDHQRGSAHQPKIGLALTN